ncbi:response regulator [Muricoccus aerilatus]|uniref:response regulator n=1 Tax=Muricoccus aerilatus TaxID=452982 RepID=UPI0005C1689B|nr:response regulator [Roseomonas aerilata]
MPDLTLRGCRILVAEDEYMIADEFCLELEEAGAVVVGPVATVEDTLSKITAAPKLNGAVLDVNLGGKMSFAAADRLMKNGTPFIFTTGYDTSVIPARFNHIERCEKPVSIAKVVRAIRRAMHGI